MKKIFALLLAFTLVFGCMLTLSPCKKDEDDTPQLNGTYIEKKVVFEIKKYYLVDKVNNIFYQS